MSHDSKKVKFAAIATGSIVAGLFGGANAQAANSATHFASLGSASEVRAELLAKISGSESTPIQYATNEGDKPAEGKCGEGKCGEGKCGDSSGSEEDKSSEGKCGE